MGWDEVCADAIGRREEGREEGRGGGMVFGGVLGRGGGRERRRQRMGFLKKFDMIGNMAIGEW